MNPNSFTIKGDLQMMEVATLGLHPHLITPEEWEAYTKDVRKLISDRLAERYNP